MEYFGLSYTLQHHNAATRTWSTVASGIEALSYEFTGAGRGRRHVGVPRRRARTQRNSLTTEYSPESDPIMVDKTPPLAPTASADRAPDYAGGGGWYKDSVNVSFSSNGDPALSDGSPGSGVNPASIPASQTFTRAARTQPAGRSTDNVGNVSEGCLTRAGRVHTAEPRSQLSDDGGDRCQRRERHDRGLRRPTRA